MVRFTLIFILLLNYVFQILVAAERFFLLTVYIHAFARLAVAVALVLLQVVDKCQEFFNLLAGHSFLILQVFCHLIEVSLFSF